MLEHTKMSEFKTVYNFIVGADGGVADENHDNDSHLSISAPF